MLDHALLFVSGLLIGVWAGFICWSAAAHTLKQQLAKHREQPDDLEEGQETFALRLYREGERKLSHELTRDEACTYRNIASHLMLYLVDAYDLDDSNS